MDDLTSTLQNILGSEEGMKQLQDLAQMLGIGSSGNSPTQDVGKEGQSLDLNGLLENIGLGQGASQSSESNTNSKAPDLNELLKGLTGGDQGGKQDDSPPLFTAADIIKLQQLMQAVKQDNPNTVLLKSLKPLLKEERRHKVDQAVRIMKLLSLLPILRESGMLNNLLGSGE